jgi:hypothetical protein
MFLLLHARKGPCLRDSCYSALFEAWRLTWPEPVSASQVLALAERIPELQPWLGPGDDSSRKLKLAFILRDHLDVTVHGLQITREFDAHQKMWRYALHVVVGGDSRTCGTAGRSSGSGGSRAVAPSPTTGPGPS